MANVQIITSVRDKLNKDMCACVFPEGLVLQNLSRRVEE